MSQPALPFLLPFRGSDLGVSKADLRVIHERVGDGSCVRAMRFSRDRISPRKRFDLIGNEFPGAERQEIETDERRMHSVLARAVERPDDPQLRMALADTLAFLDRHLMDPSPSPEIGVGTGAVMAQVGLSRTRVVRPYPVDVGQHAFPGVGPAEMANPSRGGDAKPRASRR